jgi:hypothetical protein
VHAMPPHAQNASRPASIYAGSARAVPGPGSYELGTTLQLPRGSPRGTFGTAPQRIKVSKDEGTLPGPSNYSPDPSRPGSKQRTRASFSRSTRFRGGGGGGAAVTGDPGSYNPRPRSETRSAASYTMHGRHQTVEGVTPGPGAHNITRFGDEHINRCDSFQRLAQLSPRYSFGTLARPLTSQPSAAAARRQGRPDVWPPSHSRAEHEAAAAARAGAEAIAGVEGAAARGGTAPSTPRGARGAAAVRVGRHPMQSASDRRRYAQIEKPAHGGLLGASPSGGPAPGQYEMPTTLGSATDVRFRKLPRYTVQTRQGDHVRRFISKEHSVASDMGSNSPGPAIYSRHLPVSVREPPCTRGGID